MNTIYYFYRISRVTRLKVSPNIQHSQVLCPMTTKVHDTDPLTSISLLPPQYQFYICHFSHTAKAVTRTESTAKQDK